jgi:hypothetical protein
MTTIATGVGSVEEVQRESRLGDRVVCELQRGSARSRKCNYIPITQMGNGNNCNGGTRKRKGE